MIKIIKNEMNVGVTNDDFQYTTMYGIIEVDENEIHKNYIGDLFFSKLNNNDILFNYNLMNNLDNKYITIIKEFISTSMKDMQGTELIYITFLDNREIEKFGFIRQTDTVPVNEIPAKIYKLKIE